MTRQTFKIFMLLAALTFPLTNPVYAQGSPVPGAEEGDNHPSPGSDYSHHSAPPPGPATKSISKKIPARIERIKNQLVGKNSLYHQLPISLTDAESRLKELNNELKTASPHSVKESIYALSEWLQDVAGAHWKMYKAFEKNEATKDEAKQEREIAVAFSQLKNKAKLLKAELFIKRKRIPEAIQPLVEIVCQEPRSQTGKDAYQRLVELGFSGKGKTLELASGKERDEKTSSK